MIIEEVGTYWNGGLNKLSTCSTNILKVFPLSQNSNILKLRKILKDLREASKLKKKERKVTVFWIWFMVG